MAFGSKLNQQRITQNDFDPNALNNPDVISNFTTRLEIQQPIVNLDSKYYRNATQAQINASGWQMTRAREYLDLEVEKAYIQLQLAYRATDVLEVVQETVLENKRLAENSLKQGLLQKSDLLAIEVRLNEVAMQLQYAKTNIANASNYLAVLMNEENAGLFKPADSLIQVSYDQLPTEVLSSRADLMAMQSATEAYEYLYQANEKSFYPRVNAFAAYELHDKTPLTDAGGFLLGVQLSWNILEGTSRYGKRRQLQAELEKSKLQEKEYRAKSQLKMNRKLKVQIFIPESKQVKKQKPGTAVWKGSQIIQRMKLETDLTSPV